MSVYLSVCLSTNLSESQKEGGEYTQLMDTFRQTFTLSDYLLMHKFIAQFTNKQIINYTEFVYKHKCMQ